MGGAAGTGPARYLLLLLLTFGWGSNWPAIKIAVAEMPVWQYRATTALISGAVLLAYAVARGHKLRVPRHQWLPLGFVSFTNVTAWLILIAYGIQLMESGQASLVGFTAPLWVVLLARIVLGERLTPRRLGGLALGMGGILLLLWPSLGSFGDKPAGILLVLAAAVLFGAGTIVTKRVDWALKPVGFAGSHLIIGGIPIAVIAVLSEPFTMHQASTTAWLAVAYTTIVGLILAYFAWFRAVEVFDASVASISTLAVPAFGMLAGAVVLGEPLGWRELTALVLVLSAVGLVVSEPAREKAQAT